MGGDTAATGPVFISYARHDGRSVAEVLRVDLAGRGFSVWQDVTDMQGGERWWRQIVEAIEGSAVMLLVVTEGILASPVVYDEWLHAHTAGTPVLPVTYDASLVRRLPIWLSKVDILVLDNRHADCEQARVRLYAQLTDPPTRQPRPFTAPVLPRHFVNRPNKLDEITDHLLEAGHTRPRPGLVVVHGGGGFGKTTMAAAVCYDEHVRAAFADGVLWLQFGETMTREGALTLLLDQIKLLDPQAQVANDIVSASARLRALLADRDVLLVLDDVWSHSLLQYFTFTGTTSLITTRLTDVLSRTGGQKVLVGELEAEQGAELLGRWVPVVPDAADRARLAGLANRLGKWALMIELVGAELSSLTNAGRTVAEAVAHVERRLVRDVAYLDRHGDRDRNSAIASSLDASVSLLSPDHQNRFVELAAFPSGAEIPFDTAARLWAMTGDYDVLAAEDALEAMYRLALFTRYDVRRRMLRLHDIVRDLLVGRAGDIAILHRALVSSWGDFSQLPDIYAWTYLLYHLRELRQGDEIQRLLSDFDWLYRKLRATTAAALIADFTQHCPGREGGLIVAALRMAGSALSEPVQLAAQLVGRLADVASGLPMIEELLAQARAYEAEPSLRPVQIRLLPADRGVHTKVHTGSPVLSAAITEDYEFFAVGQLDGTVGVWDWRRHERVVVLACAVGPVWSLAIQGDLVAAGGRHHGGIGYPRPDELIQVWNWRTGAHVRDLGQDFPDVSEGYYTHLAGALAAVTNAGYNNRIEIIDWAEQELVKILEPDPGGRRNRPEPVVFTPPYLLFSKTGTNSTFIWDIRNWSYLGEADGEIGDDDGVPFLVNGDLCLKDERYHRHPAQPSIPEPMFHRKEAQAEEFSEASPYLKKRLRLLASGDQTCDIWGYYTVVSSAVHYEGHTFVASDVIDIYDRLNGPIVGRLEGHSPLITSIYPVGDTLLTTSYDGTIRIWDGQRLRENLAARPKRPVELNRFHKSAISALDIQEEAVFIGTKSGMVEEWDWRTATTRREVSARKEIRTLAVNDRWMAFSAFDRIKDTRFVVGRRRHWPDIVSAPHFRAAERTRDQIPIEIFTDMQEYVVVARLCGDSCATIISPFTGLLGSRDRTGNWISVINLIRGETELSAGEWISAVALCPAFVAGGSQDGTIRFGSGVTAYCSASSQRTRRPSPTCKSAANCSIPAVQTAPSGAGSSPAASPVMRSVLSLVQSLA